MKKYLRIAAFLAFFLALFSIPERARSMIRKGFVSSVAPTWDLMNQHAVHQEKKRDDLQIENEILRQKIERLEAWIVNDQHLQDEMRELLHYTDRREDPFFGRRARYLSKILSKQLHAIPARVVFREPLHQSSVVWISVGEADNREMGEVIVAKNSPVVIGKTLVGVVEAVTEKRSSVRLITDRSLTPSVRAIRGGSQNRLLSHQLFDLIRTLSTRGDLYGAQDIAHALNSFRDRLEMDPKDLYLAKGELHGSGDSFGKQTLRGIGFNYNFPDEETTSQSGSLIGVGDLLVTTGMDGIFPPDLYIGMVTKLHPFKEGQCTYRIEAEALAGDLRTLKEVFVLPPQ